MSARRVLAGSALALLMPASLLAWAESGSASSPSGTAAPAATSVRVAAKQRVSIEALPQIVQQGKRVASPNSAKAAITATIKPVKVGRKVKLQVKKGSRWKTVANARQDRKGRADFAARASTGGSALTYRVQALPYKGLPSVESKSVSTEKWLTPTYTDEFSGSSLNPTWYHRGLGYEPESSRNCSKGDPSAVKVSGGAVRLSVIKDTTRKDLCTAARGSNKAKFAYRLNGHIGNNAYAFKYGVAAARMKMHKSRGQHTSFWMQPIDGNVPASAGHEIDVIEYFGDKHKQGGLTSFIHRYQGNRAVKIGSWIKDSDTFLANRRDGWSKNYHVFSVEWTPRKLVFRIDGKETWRISGRVSREYQVPILSILASDYELSLMKDKKLPQHAYVDWLRVWETS
jgi:beta-glucanase (GH16 family)